MKAKSSVSISNEAVLKATEKTWIQWFKILDKDKMYLKSHKEIARWIKDNFDISGWWCQEVTVQYEREKGLRQLYEKPGGFEISVGRTINANVNLIYRYFCDARLRKKWLDKIINTTTSTENKSLRALWIEDSTRISVNFYARSDEKTLVTVQHLKLKDAKSASRMKSYWSVHLAVLKSILES